MSKLFIFASIFLLLCSCGSYDLLLHNRPLHAVSNADPTQFSVVHIGGKTYLLVYTEVENYQLIARAYNEYDGNDKIWENLPDVVMKWEAFGAAATGLAAEAGNGLDALRAAIGPVGGTCGACHDAYRAPQ